MKPKPATYPLLADRFFRSSLEKYELMELIDPGRVYPTNRHATPAFRQSPERPAGAADANRGK